jgi:hypothetical protein
MHILLIPMIKYLYANEEFNLIDLYWCFLIMEVDIYLNVLMLEEANVGYLLTIVFHPVFIIAS